MQKTNGMAASVRLWISNALLFAAGAAIGVFVWSVVRAAVDQRMDEWSFDRERAAHARTEPPRVRPPAVAHGDVVGRLVIPRIHLRAMVREGTDEDTLDVALGHIKGTALPGETGNVGVAGHRDTLFRHLGEVGRDDVIQLQSLSATYVYRVDGIAIVKPEAVGVLAAGGRPQITLVTCYPFRYVGPAPKRYILKAHLESRIPGAVAQAGPSDGIPLANP